MQANSLSTNTEGTDISPQPVPRARSASQAGAFWAGTPSPGTFLPKSSCHQGGSMWLDQPPNLPAGERPPLPARPDHREPPRSSPLSQILHSLHAPGWAGKGATSGTSFLASGSSQPGKRLRMSHNLHPSSASRARPAPAHTPHPMEALPSAALMPLPWVPRQEAAPSPPTMDAAPALVLETIPSTAQPP